jgi:hypothetical protein
MSILSNTVEVHIDELTVTVYYHGICRGKVKYPSYRRAYTDLPWLRKYIQHPLKRKDP